MKLHSLALCGFRGFREPFKLEFGSGFTVLCGRNGVGKSTIFDAIEFALTGEIEKYRIEKAGKESIRDYIWWRGTGKAKQHYVTVAFRSGSGDIFSVTRTREGGIDKSLEKIEAALCGPSKPEYALRQLCRTSIVRDELIAALSLDLSETERFDLVRGALGAIEGAEYGSRAKEVLAATELSAAQAAKNYEAERIQLNMELAHLSQLRDRAARSGDISTAIATLAAHVGPEPADLVSKIAVARELLANGRIRLARLTEVVKEAFDLAAASQELSSPTFQTLKASVAADLDLAMQQDTAARTALAEAEAALASEREANAMAAALVALAEHGEHVGLTDGRCPLCLASRTHEEYLAGLAAAKKRAASLSDGLLSAVSRLETASQRAVETAQVLAAAQQRMQGIADREAEHSARRERLESSARDLQLEPELIRYPEQLEKTIAGDRENLIALERSVSTLEASQAVDLVKSAEARVASARERIAEAERTLSRAQAAVRHAKSIANAVKRTSAEIVDERLALISPLLSELYARLRPHRDWRSIDYSIRGDVRRFLSLRVGDDLNPQFIFSSGQRRAAGLAFLLSVHLARAWSKWQTLLLDDPVQHIDDFRAVHLVEVLSALRSEGRQIVCAVEDAQLADLLSRRLVSTSEQVGIRVDLAAGNSGEVTQERIVQTPLATSTLRYAVHNAG